jgi:hypothetical protein
VKLLTQFVNQFKARNGKSPTRIVIAPVAAVALALKRSLGPVWNGIPVEMRKVGDDETVNLGKGTGLGIFVLNRGDKLSIRACELR